MRYRPPLFRIRRRPVPPDATTFFFPGGVGLDIGGVLRQLELRALLDGSGARGRV